MFHLPCALYPIHHRSGEVLVPREIGRQKPLHDQKELSGQGLPT